jgi:hypothetical protein
MWENKYKLVQQANNLANNLYEKLEKNGELVEEWERVSFDIWIELLGIEARINKILTKALARCERRQKALELANYDDSSYHQAA